MARRAKRAEPVITEILVKNNELAEEFACTRARARTYWFWFLVGFYNLLVHCLFSRGND